MNNNKNNKIFLRWLINITTFTTVKVMIDPRLGCFSEEVGMEGGRQIVNFGLSTCWKSGIIIHELMHTLGFLHEQARDDREGFINVHWDNIPRIPGWKQQFSTAKDIGIEYSLIGKYDYSSIMHYPRYILSNLPSMSSKQAPFFRNNAIMGNRITPSPMDTYKINRLYSCVKPKKSSDLTNSGGSGPNPRKPTVKGAKIPVLCKDRYPSLCEGHLGTSCGSSSVLRNDWCSLTCHKTLCDRHFASIKTGIKPSEGKRKANRTNRFLSVIARILRNRRRIRI